MGQVWKRGDWNDIIDKVNELSTHPPEGTTCTPYYTIDHVEKDHVWTYDDVNAVAILLSLINHSESGCPDMMPTVLVPPDPNKPVFVWKQKWIDEINAAIAQGWCGCIPIG